METKRSTQVSKQKVRGTIRRPPRNDVETEHARSVTHVPEDPTQTTKTALPKTHHEAAATPHG